MQLYLSTDSFFPNEEKRARLLLEGEICRSLTPNVSEGSKISCVSNGDNKLIYKAKFP